MTFPISRIDLEAKNDLEWFDAMCEILKKENKPTVQMIEQLFGKEDKNCNLISGKALIPFDIRFQFASVLPDIRPDDADRPIEHLTLSGDQFFLNMGELIKRFPTYTRSYVPYDDSQIAFFKPIPDEYSFRSISCMTQHSFIDGSVYFHNVSFDLGEERKDN